LGSGGFKGCVVGAVCGGKEPDEKGRITTATAATKTIHQF